MHVQNHPTLGPLYARVERRPNWVVQAALLAAVLVVVVPLVLLVLAAVVVGFVVFVTLGLVAQLMMFVSTGWSRIAWSGDRGGRRNVRVVRR